MDFARVFQYMVCTTKHLISRREKKKMMMNSIDSNIDITLSISKLTCLSEASPIQHFLTTRLQYRTLKLLCAICSILVKLFKKHSHTGLHLRNDLHQHVSKISCMKILFIASTENALLDLHTYQISFSCILQGS